MGDVKVYKFGLAHCSVCAPKDMSREDVVFGANQEHPTGLDHGWSISEEGFRTGQTNPCPCDIFPNRVHYLMIC